MVKNTDSKSLRGSRNKAKHLGLPKYLVYLIFLVFLLGKGNFH